MKKIKFGFPVAIVVLFFVFSACENLQKSGRSQDKFLSYKIDTIMVKDTACGTAGLAKCTHVLVEYPAFSGTHANLPNEVVRRRLVYLLGQGDVKPQKGITLLKLAKKFVHEYDEFKKEFPDTPQTWFFRLKTTLNYDGKGILSISLNSVQYTGGAHNLSNKMLLNFDKKTGRFVNVLDRVEDTASFKKLAEHYFRRQMKLKPDADLNKDGHFLFPNDRFKLPINMGYGKQGYILYYNVYEIAPYSMGPVTVIIPYNRVKTK
jgi:hypothetical protein